MRAPSRPDGFSLLELMIAMAVLGIVTAFLTDLLVRQSRAYQVVDNVTETQQNLRAIGDLLEHELRVSGFMVPEAGAFCGSDVDPGRPYPDGDPDVIFLTDAEALDPGNAQEQRFGAAIQGGYSGDGTDTLSVDALAVDGNGFYDIDGDGVAESDFLYSAAPARNGGVIVVDRANPERGASCGIITRINGNDITVDFDLRGQAPNGTPLGPWNPGYAPAVLVAIPAHAYWIENGALMRDGMVLAQDIEDLQFAAFYDQDDDQVVDGAGTPDPPYASDAEYPGSRDTTNGVNGVPYLSRNWDNRLLREIRVSLVGRTKDEDPDVAANPAMAQGRAPSPENRAPIAVNDGFRRRVLTFTVRPRNVGFRQGS